MKRTRQAQTFALIHLVELVLALVVFAVVAFGILSMINGISFYEKFYARDTAYLLETLHAVPNGNVEFGYLWSTPNYRLDIRAQNVTVSKAAKRLIALWNNPETEKLVQLGPGASKAYGGSEFTEVQPASFEPRYIRYSSRTGMPRTITASAQLAAQGCPSEPLLPGLRGASYQNADVIGQRMLAAAFEKANLPLTADTGLRVMVLYESAPSPELILVDKLGTPESGRATCLLEEASANTQVAPVRGSLAGESERARLAEADIIVIVRGTANQEGMLTDALSNAIRTVGGVS